VTVPLCRCFNLLRGGGVCEADGGGITKNPEGSLPRGGGGFKKDGRGIAKNPEGNTPLAKWERDTKWRGDSSNEPVEITIL